MKHKYVVFLAAFWLSCLFSLPAHARVTKVVDGLHTGGAGGKDSSTAIHAPRVFRPAQTQETSYLIISDGTAKYSYEEQAGWQALGFDDSTWNFVIAPSQGLCAPGAVPEGEPEPIWGENPQEFQTIFVRKGFTLDPGARVDILAGADDDYDLYINGVLVGSNHDGWAGSDFYTNIQLQAGENVLAMMATDVGGGCQSVTFGVLSPCECIDKDGDGYGDPACENCPHLEQDCDDTKPNVHPGFREGPFGDPSCSDSLDNDCDGYIDAADSGCCECIDSDGDGYGYPGCEDRKSVV
jgi:hypothetical protein